MGKSGMEFKSAMDRDQVACLLEDLAKSIRQGTICAQQEPEFLTLKPADVIEVEFEAAQKKGKEKLSVELSWRQEMLAAPMASGFRISDQEPPVPVAVEISEEAPKAASPIKAPEAVKEAAKVAPKPGAKK